MQFPLYSESVYHSYQFSRPGLTNPFLDSRSSLLDSRFSILNSPFSILNSRSSIHDPRSSLPASRFSILDPRSSIPDPRFSILEARYFSILYFRSSIFEPHFPNLDRHKEPSNSYTYKILWNFVRILENIALLPMIYGCTAFIYFIFIPIIKYN